MEKLYRRVRFRDPEQLNLFVQTLYNRPALGTFVRDLHITPADAQKHAHAFDFANWMIVEHCKEVQSLQIRQFNWAAQWHSYWTAVASFKTVTSIEVANSAFPSPHDFVQLVQCLPSLTELSCGLIQFVRSGGPGRSSVYEEGDEKACPRLRSVILWASLRVYFFPMAHAAHANTVQSLDNFPPVLTSFGRAVSHLQLHQPDDSWPWGACQRTQAGLLY